MKNTKEVDAVIKIKMLGSAKDKKEAFSMLITESRIISHGDMWYVSEAGYAMLKLKDYKFKVIVE